MALGSTHLIFLVVLGSSHFTRIFFWGDLRSGLGFCLWAIWGSFVELYNVGDRADWEVNGTGREINCLFAKLIYFRPIN